MKKNLTSIVHKCICCNFLINELLKYNDLQWKKLFINMKNENLQDIRTLCYVYEYLYKDVLIPENVDIIDLNKNFNENLSTLFRLFFEIISDLKLLKSKINNSYCTQFINQLIYSYFGFTSCMNYIFPIKKFNNAKILNFNFSKGVNNENISRTSDDFINNFRDICMESAEFFFDYPLKNKHIYDENYEIFFENDPNNRFYQFFFNFDDRSIKIRISDKDSSVFYMYQILKDSLEIAPTMTNDDAKLFSDNFLKEKLQEEFDYLVFDKDYLNIYSYMNIPESYKFKYNFKDNLGKVNLNKGIYITIDARYIYIQELYLF
ncbi:hypothetical protein HF520_03230 [Romboutsia sp. CE17]|uniref:hypothetical protein n=1 Tax=Romboutsia sp. CE17 TaxID=2724150 RepID=UPI001442D658|nr:hypothetical protein [Romboutsia sp. CE17]QJA08010.1 hypothetical protein HF520_03230 [Romboutsia sp. CE17]